MREEKSDIGMVGLGVMGRNLVLNIADHGFSVAGYDKDSDKVDKLAEAAGERKITGVKNSRALIGALRSPRAVIMLVPAGKAVDSVIQDLRPHLEEGDLIIDGGNSHYVDTDRRAAELSKGGIHFFGMGISGGEAGARHGPSMMPGGDREAYEHVKPILEAAAAKVNGDPCVTYLGPRSAGHYVKMVHNGIEYAIMQLIAESYDIMKRGFGLGNDELGQVYSEWRDGELHGYLIEITADIFQQPDALGGGRLIDHILDAAKQKGTGMWTAQSAMDLQVPTMTIDTAVAMRNLSADKEGRAAAAAALGSPERRLKAGTPELLAQLKEAMYAAVIISYAQGMALLRVASKEMAYDLKLADVAKIWRGGCIIRSDLLEPIRSAYGSQPDLTNLLLDEDLGGEVVKRQGDLRAVISAALGAGIPCPALMASLGYFDGLRSAWLPANLIQAQRDYFGSHTYERVDRSGIFHTEWAGREEKS
jgi:6-phosphogluconate dehydrogenase